MCAFKDAGISSDFLVSSEVAAVDSGSPNPPTLLDFDSTGSDILLKHDITSFKVNNLTCKVAHHLPSLFARMFSNTNTKLLYNLYIADDASRKRNGLKGKSFENARVPRG